MNPSTPIRQNPWPIAILAFFAIFISLIISFIIWSTGQHMDLVRSDYYAEEMLFQQQLDRLNRTKPMSSRVAIEYDRTLDAITISLPTTQSNRPPSGSIQLYRPSDAHLDHHVRLAADAHGSQRIDARRLRPGLWKVRVQWTVDGQEYFFDQPVTIGSHPS